MTSVCKTSRHWNRTSENQLELLKMTLQSSICIQGGVKELSYLTKKPKTQDYLPCCYISRPWIAPLNTPLNYKNIFDINWWDYGETTTLISFYRLNIRCEKKCFTRLIAEAMGKYPAKGHSNTDGTYFISLSNKQVNNTFHLQSMKLCNSVAKD